MSYGRARARYTADAAQTASPARLLTMLYDRLVTDLVRGVDAMRAGDLAETGRRLGNALDILVELHSTLDTSSWEGGQALADLYVWMITEVMNARTRLQPERVADCVALVEPLRQAWHVAAGTTPPAIVAPSAATPGPVPVAAGVRRGG